MVALYCRSSWLLLIAVAALTMPIALVGLNGTAAIADEKVVLGGGAGIDLRAGTGCTLTTIGHDNAGDLMGLTSTHCGGRGAEVAAAGMPGILGSVVATNDDLDYAVIRFDASKVIPVADFDGFAINGIGPEPGLGQGVCEQSRATGRSCSYVTLSRPSPDIMQVHGCRNPDDDGAPVTANDLLVGMIKDSGPLGGPSQICGFYVYHAPVYWPPEPQIVSINSIIDDINSKGGPGAGFTPVPG